MNKEIISEIKKKREFSQLPDSIVERAASMSKGDIKESRALLRKYFGVFLTNKVLKGKGTPEEILESHISSKKRNYEEFYKEIFEGMDHVGSVIDLGAGLNGFSYGALKEAIGPVGYLAVEAAGQEVEHMNNYFEKEGFNAEAICLDLFDISKIKNLLKKHVRDRIVFMFQVVDALENLERDFSKRFILDISKECEKIVLTLPTESLGGRKKFAVQRKWIIDFLEENFEIKKDFNMAGERILVFSKKPNK